MRSVVCGGAVFALAILGGCANFGGANSGAVVVDHYAGTTDLSGYPGMGVGMGSLLYGPAGARDAISYQPLDVRQCNKQMTACALGIMNLTSRIEIVSVGTDAAKVKVDLQYQIGSEGRRSWEGTEFVTKVNVPDIINDQGVISRIAEISYGEVRHIQLPYGVDFALCVSAPGVTTLDNRPCSSRLKVLDPTGAVAF